MQQFLGVISSLILVILPLFSMGLYAEERKRGTLELLATSPITTWAVAVGKLLGVLLFFVGLLIPVMIYEALVFGASSPPMPLLIMLTAHGGVTLLAASVLSLGMFVSSLTDSTLLAAVYSFGLVLFLSILDAIALGVGGGLGDVLRHLSIVNHYGNLVRGTVDSSSIVALISYAILGVFLTTQSIEALRYQRS
jgi:ABC-2 type transport system permease protein